VVRTSFKGKTVIMVAHRLNTVIDCDQVQSPKVADLWLGCFQRLVDRYQSPRPLCLETRDT